MKYQDALDELSKYVIKCQELENKVKELEELSAQLIRDKWKLAEEIKNAKN